VPGLEDGMKALVLFDTNFGHTKKIAATVAGSLTEAS
jgi:menaquinone-dependent protoporphyrinogen IX oxidase